MRRVICAGVAVLLAAPAFGDTLKEVTTKGVMYEVQGMNIEITFTPDGKYTGMDGQLTGTWRIDGEKLCTTSNFAPTEECLVYPKDKKSGDRFELTSSLGPAVIVIK
jgi:hypothetical protein